MYAISRLSDEVLRSARLAFEARCKEHIEALESPISFAPWSEHVLGTLAAMNNAGRAYREACGLVTP
jgi:hypothetical protein